MRKLKLGGLITTTRVPVEPMTQTVARKSAEVQPPQHITAHAVLTVFLPFAGGYYLSYLYRSINAIIADRLQADVGLGAADLGLLTSAYFIAFAVFQLPLGVLLDRFGPRRVNGALLLIAALGAAIFAIGDGLLELWVGRALIGLGVAGGLMASLKAITQWFPERRWPVVNGCFLAMGGLGAISATAPVEAAMQITDWRGLFAALAAATVAVALVIYFVVPEKPRAGRRPRLTEQMAGTRAIFADRFFWRLAPVAFLCMSTNLAIQGLWAGPWLRDVAGFTRSEVASTLFLMALAMTVGFVVWGAAADFLDRRGVRLTQTLGAGVALYLLALTVIVMEVAGEAMWPWLIFGVISNITALSYTLLSRHFPLHYAGRANTALNLLVFAGAFLTQFAMGGLLDLWPVDPSGRYPVEAYRAAFGVFALACLASWIWYVVGACRARFGKPSLRNPGGGSA